MAYTGTHKDKSEWQIFTQYIDVANMERQKLTDLEDAFVRWESMRGAFRDQQKNVLNPQLEAAEAELYGKIDPATKKRLPTPEWQALLDAKKHRDEIIDGTKPGDLTAAKQEVEKAEKALKGNPVRQKWQDVEDARNAIKTSQFRIDLTNAEDDIYRLVDEQEFKEFSKKRGNEINADQTNKFKPIKDAYDTYKNTAGNNLDFVSWYTSQYTNDLRIEFDKVKKTSLYVDQGNLNVTEAGKWPERDEDKWMESYIKSLKKNIVNSLPKKAVHDAEANVDINIDSGSLGTTLKWTEANGAKRQSVTEGRFTAPNKLVAEDGTVSGALVFLKTAKDNGLNAVNFPRNADATFIAKYMIACLYCDMQMKNAPRFEDLQGLPEELKNAYGKAKDDSDKRKKRESSLTQDEKDKLEKSRQNEKKRETESRYIGTMSDELVQSQALQEIVRRNKMNGRP